MTCGLNNPRTEFGVLAKYLAAHQLTAAIRWRIDHLIAAAGLAELAKSAVVERAVDHPSRWSDHAPVTAVFEA